MTWRVATENGDYVTSAAQAKTHLQQILARPEFTVATHHPNALKRFIAYWDGRIRDWLFHWLRNIANHPTGWSIALYVMLALALGLLVWAVVRSMGRERNLLRLPASADRQPGRNSQQWMQAALRSVAGGDYRRAIQCGYWAAIAALQEAGTLPRRSERTPREYLRILRKNETASPHLPASLAVLTEQLERFFYGPLVAGPAEWARSVTSLEALGCKVDPSLPG